MGRLQQLSATVRAKEHLDPLLYHALTGQFVVVELIRSETSAHDLPSPDPPGLEGCLLLPWRRNWPRWSRAFLGHGHAATKKPWWSFLVGGEGGAAPSAIFGSAYPIWHIGPTGPWTSNPSAASSVSASQRSGPSIWTSVI
ncbi:hypothetical protein GCM10009625_20610 [Brachybacterium fresconis]